MSARSGRRRLAAAWMAAALLIGAPGPAAGQSSAAPDPRGRAQIPPLEERLLADSSLDSVAITATFSGEDLLVFGAVQRNRFLRVGDEDPHIIVVIEGPASPVIVRRKRRVLGVWLNAESFRIAEAPSFYAVSSTGTLGEILAPGEDALRRISPRRAVLIAGAPTSAADPAAFRDALIRLKQERDLYLETPGGVTLTAGTLYEARVRLPADIIEGDYRVRVFLVRGGRVIDAQSTDLPVQKTGIERTLGVAAAETPLLYGIGTLLTALLAGWGASELFRRLGR